MLMLTSKHEEIMLDHHRIMERQINDLHEDIKKLRIENSAMGKRLELLDRMDKSGTIDALLANIEASGKIKVLNCEVSKHWREYTTVKFDGEAYVQP